MKIGVLFPSGFEEPGEFLADARAMEAVGVDSIWLEDRDDGMDPMLVLASIAAVTGVVRLVLMTSKRIDNRYVETLQRLSRERFVPSPLVGEGQGGGWLRVNAPADRESWAATLQEADHDLDGILVPMNPRLLDILRHPDEAIDRSDLILAQG